ncbi:ABC transporter permease [Acidithiobacillus caldus]|uniref:ABC-type transport system involved in resistance to organic solvents, permease component n=1 Tax=Acidithiobacillus caldus (strain SM-1) TaxID=990288 RepID=F9ZR99_ACICS|nr:MULTISPECIES: ABC transporter permease [Acidithiobacillus]AEK58897.1 ABC-type transport system involved in resistance to organic solvents, permease component [Acidithiobacillus caldus SM-1]AUW33309.1 ABC transporter permease [Acidithiobacillus caldus]MBU2783783.1 ABC transporter permease [Acidithiobacillus caldus]MCE5420154.1 ABC transporter permease [Acidithiobacillus sp.]QER44236.1 putative integral membrane protein [Acidithiobacillus caldus]
MTSQHPAPASTQPQEEPHWELEGEFLTLRGRWTLRRLTGAMDRVREQLAQAGRGRPWDLRAIERLDSVGALVIWRAWGGVLPADARLSAEQEAVFRRFAQMQTPTAPRRPWGLWARLDALGAHILGVLVDLWGLFLLLGALLTELWRALHHPRHFPWREISATVVRTGPDSLPILSLIGFLIGIVISFQSAPTLASYGANIYIISIAGLSILREFGPLITAVILAGRTGSAFTAQIGAMRVTEELDALRTFGISPVQRLILPKVIALAITLPLLVVWTDAVAILGAIIVAKLDLGISASFFLREMPIMVPDFNFWLGIGKGILFGILIAWVSGYHGLKVQPNTDSLSRETTDSVVLTLTLVIVIDAVLAMVFANTGISVG